MKLPKTPFDSRQSAQADLDTAEIENRLRTTLPQAYPATNPSSELRQRLVDMTALHNERQVMQRIRRPRLLLKLAMAGMVVTALPLDFAWPYLSSALLMYRIQTAIRRTHDVHFITHDANDRSKPEREVWYRNGMWRAKYNGSKITEIYMEGVRWIVDSSKGTVSSGRGKMPDYDTYTVFHLNGSVRDAIRMGLQSRMEKVNEYWIEGQKIETYRLAAPLNTLRHTYIEINTQTNLPLRTTWMHEEEDRIYEEQTTSFAFDDPVTPEMFSIEVNSPKGIQKIHFNASKF